jgi:hypothetical protein
MTRWLQAARGEVTPSDKTDKTDETPPWVTFGGHKSTPYPVLSVLSVLSGEGSLLSTQSDEAEHPAVTPCPAGLPARQTEGLEEAGREEPFPFTEKPPFPPALPLQDEPDVATCVVPVAAREGCPTARAFGVLLHLLVNSPATYWAIASDMGISFGDAWRARDQLQRIRAIEFDRIGQMVPAPRA